jgi:hypothetical protein
MKLFNFSKFGIEAGEDELNAYRRVSNQLSATEIPADIRVEEMSVVVSLSIKQAKQLLTIMQTNDTRYYCNMACIMPAPGKPGFAFMQASDSQTLVRVEVHASGVVPLLSDSRLLCVETARLREIVAVAKAKKLLSVEIGLADMVMSSYPTADSAFPIRPVVLCHVRVDDLRNLAKALPDGAMARIGYESASAGDGSTTKPVQFSVDGMCEGLIVPVWPSEVNRRDER